MIIKRQSILILLTGVAVGLIAGLIYAWQINPVILTNIAPAQLSLSGKQQYVVLISVAYASDHDIVRAAERLNSLGLGQQTFQFVADTACSLARTNYASTTTGIIAIRSMVSLAASQGKTSCAATMLPVNSTPLPTVINVTEATFTPTLVPVASKTPSPTLGPTYTPATPIIPTAAQQNDFTLVSASAVCNVKLSGMVQITINDIDGKTGIPGIPIQITGGDTPDNFFTGLEPEHGDGFADFKMAPGGTYTIIVTGADRKPDVTADACSAKEGKSITSWQVIYRRVTKQQP